MIKKQIDKGKANGTIYMLIWFIVPVVAIWLPINIWIKFAIYLIGIWKFMMSLVTYFQIRSERKK